MKNPVGLLDKKGGGIEELLDKIFAQLERYKLEEGKGFPDLESKLHKIERIFNDIRAESAKNLIGQDDEYSLLNESIKKVLEVFSIIFFIEKKPLNKVLLIIVKSQALVQGLAQDQELAWIRDRALDLDMTLAYALAQNLNLARARAQTQELALVLYQARTQDRTQDRIRDRALNQALDQALDQTRALDQALDQAQDLAQDQDQDQDQALAYALARDLMSSITLPQVLDIISQGAEIPYRVSINIATKR